MDEMARKNMERLNDLARKAPKSVALWEKIDMYERLLEELDESLTLTQRNIIWDFWGISGELEARKAELACIHMRFPEDSE